jgi:5'-methylthioadenosine phosphorylase
MVIENLQENANFAKSIISAVAKRVSSLRPPSSFHNALKEALVTPEEHVPDKTKSKIKLFTDKYWLKKKPTNTLNVGWFFISIK